MCGRFSLSSDPARLALELDAIDEASSPPPGLVPSEGPRSPRFNIAPTTSIGVLALDVPRERLQDAAPAPDRVLRAMRWGLVPSWARDAKKLPNLFNARVETAFEKPSFRAAVKRRHCVIPMDGWYEWVPGVPASAGGKAGPKQPFHMSLPGDQGLLMAGLWEARRDPDDESITQLSCTILTTDAVGPLRRVHDRMPLVVAPDILDDWLDPDVIGDRAHWSMEQVQTWNSGLRRWRFDLCRDWSPTSATMALSLCAQSTRPRECSSEQSRQHIGT